MSEDTIAVTESQLENIVASAVEQALDGQSQGRATPDASEEAGAIVGAHGTALIEDVGTPEESAFLVDFDGVLHGKHGSTGSDAEPYATRGWAVRRAETLVDEGAPDEDAAEESEDVPVVATLAMLDNIELPEWCKPVERITRDNDHGRVRDVMFLVEDNDGLFHGKSGSGPCEDASDEELQPYWSFRGSTYNRDAPMDDPGQENPIDDALGKYAGGVRTIIS